MHSQYLHLVTFKFICSALPNSCFVNNYFEEGLTAWQANIDLQPVFNYYKAVTYMCAYFSKSEDEVSEAMKQRQQKKISTQIKQILNK